MSKLLSFDLSHCPARFLHLVLSVYVIKRFGVSALEISVKKFFAVFSSLWFENWCISELCLWLFLLLLVNLDFIKVDLSFSNECDAVPQWLIKFLLQSLTHHWIPQRRQRLMMRGLFFNTSSKFCLKEHHRWLILQLKRYPWWNRVHLDLSLRLKTLANLPLTALWMIIHHAH